MHIYLLKGTITIAPVPPQMVNPNNNDKRVVLRNCAPFTDWISEIKNTQINSAKDTDIVLLMYSNNDSKTSGSLWQYYRNEKVLDD